MALTLVGINYQLKSNLIYKNFQAGMDDYMELVFDIPKEEIEIFWSKSPFQNEKKELYGDSKESDFPMSMLNLTKGSNKTWNAWQSAKSGTFAHVRLTKGRVSKVFITDQDDQNYRCYLVWHET